MATRVTKTTNRPRTAATLTRTEEQARRRAAGELVGVSRVALGLLRVVTNAGGWLNVALADRWGAACWLATKGGSPARLDRLGRADTAAALRFELTPQALQRLREALPPAQESEEEAEVAAMDAEVLATVFLHLESVEARDLLKATALALWEEQERERGR